MYVVLWHTVEIFMEHCFPVATADHAANTASRWHIMQPGTMACMQYHMVLLVTTNSDAILNNDAVKVLSYFL
jgi:hypothetical protein